LTITAIEQEIYSGKSTPQEIMGRIYGKALGATNARKYLAGIKLHIGLKQRLDKNTAEFMQHEVSYNADKSQTVKQDIYLSENEAASPVLIMKRMGFDPLLWEVVTCRVVSGSWDVTLKNNSGKGELYTNRKYNITLTVKPLGGKLSMPQVLQAFAELPPVKVQSVNYDTAGDTMLELPIMDFHLGKLALGEETGQDDYDLKIAEQLYRDTVLELLSKSRMFSTPEYILFPVGQDYFHFDTPRVTTTSGTQLDSDTRWQKMFTKGVELLVWAAEQCRAIAPVKIMWVPGNHDQMLSYAAVVGLAQRYADTEGVSVDLTPTKRKYHLYGKCLIGFAHGENEGKRIETLMQSEAPEMWGQSLWREMHMGHVHHESAYSKGGIVFRRISSVTSADAWHAEMGFLGATRQAQAFVWDRDRGLQVVINSNVAASTEGEH